MKNSAILVGIFLALAVQPLLVWSSTRVSSPAAFPFRLSTAITQSGGSSAASDNFLISPASLAVPLEMVREGAKGETRAELDVLLGASKFESSFGSQVEVANTLWLAKEYPLLPSYVDVMKTKFHSTLKNLDFLKDPEDSRIIINDSIAKATHDKIKDLIPPPLLSSTKLILTNAIYLKAKWLRPFEKSWTQPDEFHTSSSESSKVPTLHQIGNFRFSDRDHSKFLEMDYADADGKPGDLVMDFLLPDSASGVQALNVNDLSPWIREAKGTRVRVSIPKFKLEQTHQLGAILRNLGLKSAFVSGKADFSGIGGTRNLVISEVIQKVMIQVDEEGTEAAAATAMVLKAGMDFQVVDPPRDFNANHPFLFFLRSKKSGQILFMGRLSRP